jgi:acyl carrier protein
MTRPATTIDWLRTIIARDFDVDPQLLQTDVKLNDLAIDSLGVIEILFAVEEAFGITVPPEPPDARDLIDTLGDLAHYIDRLVSEQHGVSKTGETLP